MSTYQLRPPEAEPQILRSVADIYSRASRIVTGLSYIVPHQLQTDRYTRELLSRGTNPALVDLRAAARASRESALTERGVSQAVYMGAAALEHLHWAPKPIMVAQLDHVVQAVRADMEAGKRSILKVGIVPTSIIPAQAEDLPPGQSLMNPRDAEMVYTEDHEVYTLSHDSAVIDRLGESAERDLEVEWRLGQIGAWERDALIGPEALDCLEDSRRVLLRLPT